MNPRSEAPAWRRNGFRVPLAGLLMHSAVSAMLLTTGALVVGALTVVALTGCESDPGGGAAGAAGSGSGGSGAAVTGGEEVAVDVSAGRAFVRLDPPAVVGASDDWDLAFEGHDVFTNSGPSGSGQGSAFGPLDRSAFDAGVDPGAPFTTPDRAGGAFLDWYSYEGAPAHVLWSRYHVHAVADGDRRWKVQVLGYYGDLAGEPVSALYRLRYAELTADGVGPTQELPALDATAGGTAAAPATAPSACVNLATGEVTALTPADAAASTAWHLCLRRQSITVNGEQGGPGAVAAVDLDEGLTASETVAEVKTRTADSERARFEAVTRSSLDGRTLRGDRVVSAFDTLWLDRTGAVPAPDPGSWLVVRADGRRRALVVFDHFDHASATTPGTVHLHTKSIEGNPLK